MTSSPAGQLAVRLAAALFLGLAASAAGSDAPPPSRPNIVFILADDLGWADLGVYGSTFHETPHLDRLAREGMRFTSGYAAAPVCSPTRTSLLTGRYPARVRVTDWIPGLGDQPGRTLLQVEDLSHLPLSEVTVAELLRRVGYATAHIGKWHLGGKGKLPTDQGFAVNVSGDDHGHPPSHFYPYRSGTEQLHGLDGGREGEYLTDRLGEEAARFIRSNRERPFFLYLPHYAVHTPVQAPEPLVAKYRKKLEAADVNDSLAAQTTGELRIRTAQTNPVYAAMVESLDQSVGRVMAALEENGVADRTIVIFTSDNGGLSLVPRQRPVAPTSNSPLRAGKGWLYEGGIRVPLLVHWPGATRPGSVSDLPTSSVDVLPTLLEMAGVRMPMDRAIDGLSIVPALRGTAASDRGPLFWHYPHYHGSGARPAGAIRMGDWKLVEWYENGAVELYNLRTDLAERNDLAAANPARRDDLRARLAAWRQSVKAQMPEPAQARP